MIILKRWRTEGLAATRRAGRHAEATTPRGALGRKGNRAWALALAGAGAAALIGSAPEAAAQSKVFELSTGIRLELPSLSDIGTDCQALRSALQQIDATGYRSGPRPRNPADRPLFEYEQQASTRLYNCAPRQQMFFGGIKSFQ